MKFTDKHSSIDWTSYHTGFHDTHNKTALANTGAVAFEIVAGWSIAGRLGMVTPDALFSVFLIITLLLAAYRLVGVFFQRDKTMIIPSEGDAFAFELKGDDQVVWKSEMDDGSCKDVPLYKNGYHISKVNHHGKSWYRLCGTPNECFVKMAKGNDAESYYAVTDICLHISCESMLSEEAMAHLEGLIYKEENT